MSMVAYHTLDKLIFMINMHLAHTFVNLAQVSLISLTWGTRLWAKDHLTDQMKNRNAYKYTYVRYIRDIE